MASDSARTFTRNAFYGACTGAAAAGLLALGLLLAAQVPSTFEAEVFAHQDSGTTILHLAGR